MEIAERRVSRGAWIRYQQWVLERMVDDREWARQRAAAWQFAHRPTISILTTISDTAPDVLRTMLSSVRNQSYPHWQHCLVDDDSSERWICRFLERHATADKRIVFRSRAERGGIGAAVSDALEAATGDFILVLDQDDALAPQALFEVASLLQSHPEAETVTSEVDVIGSDGTRWERAGLTDRSGEPDRLSVYRRDFVIAGGGLFATIGGSADQDRIFHIPDVLYHRRAGASEDLRTDLPG